MKKVRCQYCGFTCIKYGKNSTGKQRWYCKECQSVFVNPIDRTTHDLKYFLDWLFSKNIQKDMNGSGRTFRRKTAEFWDIWPMPPKIDTPQSVVYVDGIYLAKKACILICCNDTHILGWYLCRSENSRSWEALMRRICAPEIVISDGGSGFRKALKKVWPNTRLQRCIFHVFCQVKRYTTTRPKTVAGFELYRLAKDVLKVKTHEEALAWVNRLTDWRKTHKKFLEEQTKYADGTLRDTHERLLKAENVLIRLVKTNTLFVYLDAFDVKCPATNNRIEGAVNAQLRAMLRNHRGLSIERRIKAVFWWCYMHTEKPLSHKEILETMPTDTSISHIYNTMNSQQQLEGMIPSWGDSIVWSDLHKSDTYPIDLWD